MNSVRWLVVSACLALSGCGGGGGGNGSGAFCESISGGASQLSSSCAGCSLSNTAAAADNNLMTAANATVGDTATSVSATLRATAQNGVVYAAGNDAGVFFSADVGLCSNCATTISTYMGDVVQESGPGFTNTDAKGHGTPAQKYSSISTTLPFDAVEITATGATIPGNPGTFLQVYEICSNGGVQG